MSQYQSSAFYRYLNSLPTREQQQIWQNLSTMLRQSQPPNGVPLNVHRLAACVGLIESPIENRGWSWPIVAGQARDRLDLRINIFLRLHPSRQEHIYNTLIGAIINKTEPMWRSLCQLLQQSQMTHPNDAIRPTQTNALQTQWARGSHRDIGYRSRPPSPMGPIHDDVVGVAIPTESLAESEGLVEGQVLASDFNDGVKPGAVWDAIHGRWLVTGVVPQSQGAESTRVQSPGAGLDAIVPTM